MSHYYPELSSASDWLKKNCFIQSEALPDLSSNASSVWNSCARNVPPLQPWPEFQTSLSSRGGISEIKDILTSFTLIDRAFNKIK